MATTILIENTSREKLEKLKHYAEKLGLDMKMVDNDEKSSRFIVKPHENSKRSLLKAISYRLYQSFVISPLIIWGLTGNPILGLKFGVLEVIVKIPAYYLFERIWARIRFGYKK
ncbi:MAG: DUF2061 domain-containing protein [Crenarchaeota archaeon]|nr:DUF2061 domain-containing protein [Thermoproteota archaeon]